MSVRQVCTKLELTFGQCKSDTRAVLNKEGVKEQTKEQLEDALDHVEEEHHAIISWYKSDRHRFCKFIEEKENNILQKNDPFLKTVADMCRVLAVWKNGYKYNRFSDPNDGVSFTTIVGPVNKNKGKTRR